MPKFAKIWRLFHFSDTTSATCMSQHQGHSTVSAPIEACAALRPVQQNYYPVQQNCFSSVSPCSKGKAVLLLFKYFAFHLVKLGTVQCVLGENWIDIQCTILMTHHANSTLEINAFSLRTASSLGLRVSGGSCGRATAITSKVLLDDGNRIINPRGIFQFLLPMASDAINIYKRACGFGQGWTRQEGNVKVTSFGPHSDVFGHHHNNIPSTPISL